MCHVEFSLCLILVSYLLEWHYSLLEWHYNLLEWHYNLLD